MSPLTVRPHAGSSYTHQAPSTVIHISFMAENSCLSRLLFSGLMLICKMKCYCGSSVGKHVTCGGKKATSKKRKQALLIILVTEKGNFTTDLKGAASGPVTLAL